jgi:glycosyltransferase involved in cell wall biosynthesis
VRTAICWTEISGYTAACWRSLAARPGVELSILAWPSNFSRSGTQFERSLMQGLPIRFLEEREQQDVAPVRKLVEDFRPDTLMIGGWAERPYRDLVRHADLADCRIVLAMDTQWKGNFRQRFARLKIGAFIDRLDAVFVPGERGVVFAKHLKVPEDRIFRGMLGFDDGLFANAYEKRAASPWPKSFVYLGRYSVEKALDVMTAGYAKYREAVPDPWPLACYGSGPMQHLLENQPGIEVHGWTQPADQPDVLARHGVFVLTSWTDAWGIAVVEAMASGLPVICTEAVGSVADLVRPYHNGLITPTNDPDALARAMQWMHHHHERLPKMGQAATHFAAPYAATVWVDRFLEMSTTLRQLPRRR